MSPQNKILNNNDIYDLLSSVKDIDGKVNIVQAKKVSSLVIKKNHIGFAIQASANDVQHYETLRQECVDMIEKAYPGFRVTAVLTAESDGKTVSAPVSDKRTLPGVKRVLLVASGKGGVGKSTVAVHLAMALKRAGYKVGMVDADIYGPSIPKMLGVKGQPTIDKNNKMVPLQAHGIAVNSIGFLVDETRSTIWRGPMATKALYQLLIGTAWEELDFVIVDMPPGTGDIQLTLAKNFVIDGAVLVSTPQEVAVLDVAKAHDMFTKVEIPILGVIENMSYIQEAGSSQKNYIFGKNNVKNFAKRQHITYLGDIALDGAISQAGDNGSPLEGDTVISDAVCQNIIENIN